MHRRSILRAMFRYSRSGFSATWPARLVARPAALVGFDPSQFCSCHAGKAVRHPHCLSPPAVSCASIPAHFCREIDRQDLQTSPTLEGDRPRMPQRGSWALSSRAIRALPMPPLADRQGRYCLGLGLFQACRHRLMRSLRFFQSLAGRQPPEAASGSYPLMDFVGGKFLRCSGKAIAEENRRIPPILQRIEGLTPG